MAVRVIRVVMAFGHILVLRWVSRLFDLVHVFFSDCPSSSLYFQKTCSQEST
jgi:hypothetical protein